MTQGKPNKRPLHATGGKNHKPLTSGIKPEPRKTGYDLYYVIVIVILTTGFFYPVLRNEFIPTWDDNSYIIDNSLIREISMTSLEKMFTTQVGGTYVPLPLLSYAIEYQIWGLNPVAFHVTNLILHLVCTFLVFRILRKLKLHAWFAAAGALIYGIHPMGVESVAWVTERKDLLYGVFYFGALLLYIYYVGEKKSRRWYYISALFVFLLALFSKIQAVSLPLVMFLVDYYFHRTDWRKSILEKIPFLVLSLVFGVAGIFVLKSVGALKVNEIFTLTERTFFGIYTFCAYLVKFIFPLKLSAFYPYPGTSGSTLPVIYYLSPLMVTLLGVAVYFSARKFRAIAFGFLFFVFSVFFMLQIFGAGAGFLADRYTKIPYLGLVFLLSWGLQEWTGKKPRAAYFIWPLLAGFALFLGMTTIRRCQVWKNGETLWSDVIEKYPGRDSRPYACRGLYYRAEKNNEKALADMNVSLSLDRDDAEIMLMRGNIYFEMGKDDVAYADYLRVMKIKEDNALGMGNLGALYVRRNQYDSAVYYLSKSISLDSSEAVPFANRAVAYGALGRVDESIADFKRYLRIDPDNERVYMSIALAYQRSGRYQESLPWFDEAIRRKPGFGNYYYFRSQSYKSLGDNVRAREDVQSALAKGVKVPDNYIRSLQ